MLAQFFRVVVAAAGPQKIPGRIPDEKRADIHHSYSDFYVLEFSALACRPC